MEHRPSSTVRHVRDRPMTDKSRILCDLVPKTNIEEVPNEQVPTRYLAAVPMSKFLLWEIVWPQRRCKNSSFEHAHYGALRFRPRAYRPVKGVVHLVHN
jgi:hypothetical protein